MHVMDKGNLWCSVVFKVEDTKDEREIEGSVDSSRDHFTSLELQCFVRR
jgi:hypothetical protein